MRSLCESIGHWSLALKSNPRGKMVRAGGDPTKVGNQRCSLSRPEVRTPSSIGLSTAPMRGAPSTLQWIGSGRNPEKILRGGEDLLSAG
jgi:hypothetical protein